MNNLGTGYIQLQTKMIKVEEMCATYCEKIAEEQLSIKDKLKARLLLFPQIVSLCNTKHTLPPRNIKMAFSFYALFIVIDTVSLLSHS